MDGLQIAKIALAAATYAIDRPYDYLIPVELAGRVDPGMRVMVPFGRGNRLVDGVVLAVRTQTEEGDKPLKAIQSLLDDSPVLDQKGISLALWMSRRCFCTVYDCIKAMLPAGLWFARRDEYVLANGVDRERAYDEAGKSEIARRILDVLFANEGRIERERLCGALGTQDPSAGLKRLTETGVILLETSAARNVRDKTEQIGTLAIPAEEAMAQVTPRRKSAPLHFAVVELLATVGSASTKELCYFTGASNATLRTLEKKGLITLHKREVLRRVDMGSVEPAGPIVLNEAQQGVFLDLDRLCREERPAAALLYGVTGSGKTQVYMKLIEQVLSRGKTAMVLVPEIALTPQLQRMFAARFGESVAVLHSSLRAGERYDEWKRVRSGKARVVLGTRSAVFAPLKDLGIIVLDEEQEGTYKSENTPRYHARDVAKYRCAEENALLLLGSATPSVETMYLAQKGTYQLYRLPDRFNARALPDVYIADLKRELQAGNHSGLSDLLCRELKENLTRGEQSILFLNRRGANRMVTCAQCGEAPVCPRCSVHLTYHSANRRLMCHYCGHSQPIQDYCPSCGGRLNFIGIGTQKVQEELERLFPGVEVMRMDTDTVTATHSHEKMLSKFEKDKIPILVGTQMVAKGLDFENVTLVGVISADMSLYVDDFRAGERTFSLLTQVVGRAGRGRKRGRAVIQTYTPDNDVIHTAAAQDYDSFYEREIRFRSLRGMPPFRDIFQITVSGLEEHAVLRACQRLRVSLDKSLARSPYTECAAQLLGPAPASVTKVNNRYRYRLTLSCNNTKEIRALVAHVVKAAQNDRENRGISVFADHNPMD